MSVEVSKPQEQEFQSKQSLDPAMDKVAEAFYNRGNSGTVEEGADAEPEVEHQSEQADSVASEAIEEVESGEVADVDDPLVEVVIDGSVTEIPFSELRAGYQRHQDYTRKTMEVAEHRRQLESASKEVGDAQRNGVARLNHLARELQAEISSNQPNPREMARLRSQDPGEYAARVADEQRRANLLTFAQQEQQALEQKHIHTVVIPRAVEELKSRVEEFALDFGNTYNQLGLWVTSPTGGGLSEGEWNMVTDPRQVLIAYKAWKADKQGATVKAATPRLQKKLSTMPKVRSGAPVDPGQNEQAAYQDSLKALNNDSSTAAIAEAFRRRAAVKNTR